MSGVVDFLDTYMYKGPISTSSYARGNAVLIVITILFGEDVSEQRVYYDFPKTTDGTLWGSRVIMFGW